MAVVNHGIGDINKTMINDGYKEAVDTEDSQTKCIKIDVRSR